MLNNFASKNIYISCAATDMRKSIDGLAAIVQMSFKLDPFSNCYFVFCNKNKDKIKILHWDCNEYWLYYKRLEKGKFNNWPKSKEDVKKISSRELSWLLSG